MSEQDKAAKFTSFLAIIAAPFAIGAFLLSSIGNEILEMSDSTKSGFVSPRDMSSIITNSQNSTVIIECDSGQGSLGSGWAIQLESENSKKSSREMTSLITAHHVIEDCLDTKIVKVYVLGKDRSYQGFIEKWDKQNDLALLSTKAEVKAFELSEWPPLEGYWAMTVGAPEGIEASVTIGYIMNYSENEIYFTAPISGGNSGGPLLDNEGRIVGTVIASAADSDFNIATSLDGMCRIIIECKKGSFWTWK